MEINEYVRILTCSGHSRIAKLIKIDDICITDNGSVDKNNIIKHSKDITELLEVGDIIEFEVTDEDNYSHIFGINFVRIETEEELIDIKDIVLNESAKIMNILTKQQFSQNAYKIEKER